MTTHDFDGTVMLSPFKQWWLHKWFVYPNPLVDKRTVKVIVTGRPKSQAWIVYFYLWLYGFKRVLATFRESEGYTGIEEIIRSKIGRLKLLGASCHYDDDPQTCIQIKRELEISVIRVDKKGLTKL